ncbi:hypothetical protein [Amycolatopsis aidingensis]|nr:hypothetical protein [Amycolatopsis aidingensis]
MRADNNTTATAVTTAGAYPKPVDGELPRPLEAGMPALLRGQNAGRVRL